MTRTRIAAISRTLDEIATTTLSEQDLLRRVRERHPQATTEEIARAALRTVTDPARDEGPHIARLYDLALTVRRSFA